ncbi:MAG: DNA/pantothenate metabolism flavoprotein domain protein [Verrucomicrobiales bacterium]|nr:DNA/pantothenate metabolism flavoprotein domain protein [Verrucomicrobiales bacterium]
MRLIVTTGPAWEPLDGMRRLTNASTGALGALLADRFTEEGHQVILLRGKGSTADRPRSEVEVVPFGTNDDLAAALEGLANSERGLQMGAVFHAAALCDFRVCQVSDARGQALSRGKISSRLGRVLVELEPATKVLPRLRSWFPHAWIVGWKYEIEGDRQTAMAAAARQTTEAGVDACVINGPAWGDGFGLHQKSGSTRACADRWTLAELLVSELKAR